MGQTAEGRIIREEGNTGGHYVYLEYNGASMTDELVRIHRSMPEDHKVYCMKIRFV